MLYGMSDGLLRKVQSIQNAAARLVTGARRCDHITPVLHQLHSLPVHQRVEYKVACLVHQSGQTPAYIAEDIQLVTDSDRRQLRSAAARTCLVPRTHNNFGDQCCRATRAEQFHAAPATRHELCAFQASTENISIWELVNHGALWLFAVLCLRNTLTYLHLLCRVLCVLTHTSTVPQNTNCMTQIWSGIQKRVNQNVTQ